MIDFKFHVVSLIAVFMALAVGILLGAGPLGGALGDTLRGQVQDLRTDREEMRAELTDTRADLDSVNALLEEGGPRLVDGTLDGGRVALLAMPGTNGDDLTAVQDSLADAGAEIVVEGVLSETLVTPAMGEERIDLLDDVAPDAEPDADPVATLGGAIADALTIGHDETESLDDVAADGELLDVLLGAGEDLVTLQTDPEGRADVVVVVGARPEPEPDTDPDEDSDEDGTPDVEAEAAERRIAHVTALQAFGAMADEAPFVLVGAGESTRDLVGVLRDDLSLAPAATSVDSVGSVSATVVTPLAVAATLDGIVEHYGFDEGAEAVLPPAVATPAERRAEGAPPAVDPESPTQGESPTGGTGGGTGADDAGTGSGDTGGSGTGGDSARGGTTGDDEDPAP
ncbi:copper transporter [Georgenia sp. Z1491]|uniref:copper transporter n=1 Tax=Georgenia sp. Z1491 TaxID=3416707 RepID=UPI003CF57C05